MQSHPPRVVTTPYPKDAHAAAYASALISAPFNPVKVMNSSPTLLVERLKLRWRRRFEGLAVLIPLIRRLPPRAQPATVALSLERAARVRVVEMACLNINPSSLLIHITENFRISCASFHLIAVH